MPYLMRNTERSVHPNVMLSIVRLTLIVLVRWPPGQIILDARKQERMTQSDLAKKVGTDKTYISRIEKGAIEPGVGLFFRIMDALGLKVEIARPLM